MVKGLSDTRWSAHFDAVTALHGGFEKSQDALDALAVDADQEWNTRREAEGLSKKMEKLETIFLTIFWNDILERVNKTSNILQSKDVDILVAIDLLKSPQLVAIDLLKSPQLVAIDLLKSPQLVAIDLLKSPQLVAIDLLKSQLVAIDLLNSPQLVAIDLLKSPQLVAIDLLNSPQRVTIDLLKSPQLGAIDLLKYPQLVAIDLLNSPQLVAIDLLKSPQLVAIDLLKSPQLVAIDLLKSPQLVAIDLLKSPQLVAIDVLKSPQLVAIDLLKSPQLVAIDLLNSPQLVAIDLLKSPQLVAIDLLNSPQLVAIDLLKSPQLVAIDLFKSLKAYLKEMRDTFSEYEAKTKSRCPDSKYSDGDKRARKRSVCLTRHDGSAEQILHESEKFKVETYLPIQDSLNYHLTKRAETYESIGNLFSFFSQLKTIDCNELSQSQRQRCEKLANAYHEDLDYNELINESKQFKHYIVHPMKNARLFQTCTANSFQIS